MQVLLRFELSLDHLRIWNLIKYITALLSIMHVWHSSIYRSLSFCDTKFNITFYLFLANLVLWNLLKSLPPKNSNLPKLSIKLLKRFQPQKSLESLGFYRQVYPLRTKAKAENKVYKSTSNNPVLKSFILFQKVGKLTNKPGLL